MVIGLKKRDLGSNGQHFKKFFRNFEAQIGQKLRNLRLDHFSKFLINKKKCSGEKPFQCSLCPKAFKSNGELTQHKRFHSEEKPFQCSLCQKTFKSNQHKQSHNGKKHSHALHV